MGARVVFDAATEVVVPNVHPTDIARQMAGEINAGHAGTFLYVNTRGGKAVWVNPMAVAYLEETAD